MFSCEDQLLGGEFDGNVIFLMNFGLVLSLYVSKALLMAILVGYFLSAVRNPDQVHWVS